LDGKRQKEKERESKGRDMEKMKGMGLRKVVVWREREVKASLPLQSKL